MASTSPDVLLVSPAARMQEERVLHEAKLAKMEAEMKMVFQQKVQEKESKLKQSEEELYARHKEMKDALDKQRGDLEEKKRKIESGRPLTPEKNSVSSPLLRRSVTIKQLFSAGYQEKPLPPSLIASVENISSSSRELISCLLRPFIPSCYLDHYSTIVHFISMVLPIFSHSFAHRPHSTLLS